ACSGASRSRQAHPRTSSAGPSRRRARGSSSSPSPSRTPPCASGARARWSAARSRCAGPSPTWSRRRRRPACRPTKSALWWRGWGLYFVNENLFGVVPELVDKLEQALGRAYPGASFEVPPFFQLGCWIGGDRDGNPFVTNDATRRTLCETRVASLRRYRVRL